MLETNTIGMLFAEARGGRVFSIMPVSALPGFLVGTDVRIHPIRPECRSEIGLLRLRRDIQPPLSDAVWKLASGLDLQRILDAPLDVIPR